MAQTNRGTLDIDLADHVVATLSGGDEFEDYVGGYESLYMFDCEYTADNDKGFSCFWTSKDLDFTEQHKEWRNYYFTVERVLLEYVDYASDTPVTVKLSSDGGQTWSSVTQQLGSGDKTQKVADFWFGNKDNITAKIFRLRLESGSVDKHFIWTGINIIFYPRGRYIETT